MRFSAAMKALKKREAAVAKMMKVVEDRTFKKSNTHRHHLTPTDDKIYLLAGALEGIRAGRYD